MKLLLACAIFAVLLNLSEVRGQIEPCLATMKIKPICPVNEVYTCCKTCFERTCQNRYIAVKCALPCRGGCICKTGYIRIVTNGKCIAERSCPKIGILIPDIIPME
ncbi:chymotrypsin-elastase inhibitor ixodidin-like [Anopheles nili]|uniref:chymotrypsin-elastase inhibitor ixodidin-like n=1 Tax=Anopheles nili TaxID=185578 RepID=UPI00237B37CF|nr:chymotrypsin-elastase inhibitor ixodidin-like [Anopheles nili]